MARSFSITTGGGAPVAATPPADERYPIATVEEFDNYLIERDVREDFDQFPEAQLGLPPSARRLAGDRIQGVGRALHASRIVDDEFEGLEFRHHHELSSSPPTNST